MPDSGDNMCEGTEVRNTIRDQMNWNVSEGVENESRDMQERGWLWETEKDWYFFLQEWLLSITARNYDLVWEILR